MYIQYICYNVYIILFMIVYDTTYRILFMTVSTYKCWN